MCNVLNRNMNTFYWNNSTLRTILLCVFNKTVICKYWEHSFIKHYWNHVFLNSYIYANGMFFLAIIVIHFIETTKNYTIFWLCIITICNVPYHFEDNAFFMIFWNVFIHSLGEWSEKCRKDRRNLFINSNGRLFLTII